MKIVILFIVGSVFVGCRAGREVQAEFVNVQLVKIDTIYRYQKNEIVLTWKCRENVELVSFVSPYEQQYKIGSTYKVLMTK
jgi:hypothetical protein